MVLSDEAAKRTPMTLLKPGEAGAIGALAEVLAQTAPLLAPEPPVGRPRDGQLCLGARQLVF